MFKWVSVMICLSGSLALAQAQALESQDVGPEVEVVQYPPSQQAPSEVLSEQSPSQPSNDPTTIPSPLYYSSQPQQNSNPAPSQPNYNALAPSTDSVVVYSELIEKYQTKGQRLKGKGSVFLWSGVAMTTLGVILMVKGIQEMDCTESYEDEDGFYYETNSGRSTCENADMFAFGYLSAIVGAGGITTGIILKAIGGKSLRNARRYERSLESYQMSKGVYNSLSFQMNLIPVIDPREGRAGAQLSLLF